MQMRMQQQVLAPGVQNGEEPDVRAEMLRVARDGEQGFGGRTEQDVIDDLLVLKGDTGQSFGKGEDDVEVLHRQ
jgi:hypothetical protein